MASETKPKVSVVIPFYNEEANVTALLKRLFDTLNTIPESWEVVCVNDGSRDATLKLLLEEKKRRKGMVVVDLARNFGQHSAVMAGFRISRGEWVVTLDADLQNPPEEVPRLLDAFRKGHDLIGTIRQGRKDTLFRKFASRITNKLTTKMSGISLQDFGCMLRGYSREVVNGILSNPEYRTFIPALATFFARNPVEIPVRHEERAGGRSKYSLMKLLGLQLDLMLGFSMWPLRILFFVGAAVAALGLFLGAFILAMRLYFGAGWAAEGVFTLFAVLFFIVGGQFFALGLIGDYIGRIFQAVRGRPGYVLREIYRNE
ncbi:MAG: glycosyltransferase [Dissulfurimicrobium sp.]|uniref:glycosyltransferase n=1 Tax=Dissulfurimicrobium TaxID=1769732 RepID=UPI001EDA57A6|nr:glycosyltransferase [Dissulfurimicrobium hydrothermale]UKL13052.1 glycosyltransferase [Dissulfurimicrobium hydrothermale]